MKTTVLNKKSFSENFLFDGMTIAVGGIGGAGYPRTLIKAILESDVKDLTLIFIEFNAQKDPEICLADLATSGKVKKVICSHMGCVFNNKELINSLEIELFPMGILSQKIQAGANNIPGIVVDENIAAIYRSKDYLVDNYVSSNEEFIFEPSLRADLAIIEADYIDKNYNAYYTRTMYNSAEISKCAKKCVVEVLDDKKHDCKFDMVDIEFPWINGVIVNEFKYSATVTSKFNSVQSNRVFNSLYELEQYQLCNPNIVLTNIKNLSKNN